MALCEIVGGPRDGEKFSVPGSLPPEEIRVLDNGMAGPLTMWHPAARSVYAGVQVVVCRLENVFPATPRPDAPWRYLWGRYGENTETPKAAD